MTWFRRRSNAPLWQDEFPVFTADERYVSRRQFAKFLTLTSFGMVVGNYWILLRSWFYRSPSYPSRPVAALDELPVGGSKTFTYPTEDDHCILVRTGTAAWVAYSQKCTHLSCAVYYAKEINQLACPCHKGYFSVADGAVLQGPPQRPLPRVTLENRNGALVATGMQGETA